MYLQKGEYDEIYTEDWICCQCPHSKFQDVAHCLNNCALDARKKQVPVFWVRGVRGGLDIIFLFLFGFKLLFPLFSTQESVI